MIMTPEEAEVLWGEERVSWYRLTPMERMARSATLWKFYLKAGGSLDSRPDIQSPFDDPEERRARPIDGRSGVRLLRRGGI